MKWERSVICHGKEAMVRGRKEINGRRKKNWVPRADEWPCIGRKGEKRCGKNTNNMLGEEFVD